eukprot:357723-Chlamydomonas_euryale.AAC.11
MLCVLCHAVPPCCCMRTAAPHAMPQPPLPLSTSLSSSATGLPCAMAFRRSPASAGCHAPRALGGGGEVWTCHRCDPGGHAVCRCGGGKVGGGGNPAMQHRWSSRGGGRGWPHQTNQPHHHQPHQTKEA